ncbi:molecular chaperone SurA [Herbaspirillum seropedicae]|uniref:Chaperone SurA n=2 Tax=Herbaspirillum seropedicae TaxID=964 RepID=D8IZA5_HERSS|nr:peptidylprolyl isomerase [Herbaspirillum seropedicae]ADJ62225.1 parvulin-like peptidyl-prolyl cis-trans isomerase protein [Herbaspirillum seropedicae SmR1]AKN64388.1 molecular chaperone SurA [Herbaspirillum seropedicae]NQE27741.1 molecular chaperone SurA [Herbaspirillum seropedicae]UMU20307.1 molecular chaperone SurA [Herbaspirillum seropedicae]CAM32660.1 Parvulin-like peptidyl-prolyl [Herbaspirillum seropedicae]
MRNMRTPLLATTKTVTALLCMLGVISNAQAQFATTIIPVTPPETSAQPAPANGKPPAASPAAPAKAAAPAPAKATAAAPSQARVEPRPVDSIMVVVNNEVITRQEVADRLASVVKRMSAQNVQLPPRDQLVRQLVERMIVERAQAQMAKENGIVVDDAMLDRAMQRIADQNKLSMAQFRTRLEAEGMNYASFREEIRREILSQRLREREVDNKVVVTESEVDNYLAAEANAGGQRQELDIAQILIRVPENATPDQLAQRRERAEDVLRQLKTGADFAKTAAAYSDASDALSGGDLGWRPADRLPQLFLDGVAKLQDGQVSGLLKSGNGFHILKLVGRRTADGAQAAAPAVQQTHVRHILIKVNQVVTAAEAKRKLTELKERLDHGSATFEELAKLYSNDLSASKGGDLGWVYPGDTVPEFERAMDQLKPGEVSQPIETPFGYHLIQVVERKTDDASKERARQAARQAIRERKIDEATEDWMRQIRDRAYVEYRNDE